MEYYLNQYYPIISKPNGTVVFPLSGKTEYDLENMRRLINGEPTDEESIVAGFGKEIFEKWLSESVLLTEPPDMAGRYSRSDSFCYFMNIPGHREKLKKAKILILGCGGIGSHVAWNMAALGIGHIYLVDGDCVEVSNLNRQLLYDMEDLGRPKALSLGQKLKKINPDNSYYPICQNIDSKQSLSDIIRNISPDVIVKSFDSPIYISSWVDEVCEELQVRYVCGIMNGTKQLIGPTYIGKGSAKFGDFFDINTDMEKISGIGPSLSFELSGIAAELSEEIFKLITGYGTLKYKNKISEYENITNKKTSLTNIKTETDKGLFNIKIWKNLFLILVIYGIVNIITGSTAAAFAVTLLYSLIAPLFISGSSREAIIYSDTFVISSFILNCFIRLSTTSSGISGFREFMVFFTISNTILSIAIILSTVFERMLWKAYRSIFCYITKKKSILSR